MSALVTPEEKENNENKLGEKLEPKNSDDNTKNLKDPMMK